MLYMTDGSGKMDAPEVIEIPVWNGTVANLTLMALGSSAPEILLSIIEIVGNNFESGELGPGTIVGSAAFNLLAISAVCVVGVPKGETRRIDQVIHL
jgi:solute carrier family 8 (sodium/calcium exchanger)